MPKTKSTTRTKKPSTEPAQASAKVQLDSFLDKFTPEIAAAARRALARMRKLVPGAIEMVYDNTISS